jgi:hypothetical protein
VKLAMPEKFCAGVNTTLPAAFNATVPFCAPCTDTKALVSPESGSVSFASKVAAAIVTAVSSWVADVSPTAVGAWLVFSTMTSMRSIDVTARFRLVRMVDALPWLSSACSAAISACSAEELYCAALTMSRSVSCPAPPS